MSRNGHRDVMVQVPTAHGVLSASPPPGEVDADDVIKFQATQLHAAHQRIQELEIGLGTVTNIASCALKVLADRGFGDDGSSDTFSFSRELSDRMRGSNITISEDFAGGLLIKFRERATGPIQLDG